jgi:hypothetical protein
MWAPVNISGFEDRYKVSKGGKIKSVATGVIRKARIHATGDKPIVDLKKDGKRKTVFVHRVVAEAYHEKPSELHNQVNHVKGDKEDFRAKSLEWVTPSENSKHARRTGLYGRYVRQHTRVKNGKKTVVKSHRRK